MLDLASHIVKTKAGHFDPDKFEDQYEDALKELLKKKQEGKPIERPERPKPTNVVNLMDALRQSVVGNENQLARRSAESRSPLYRTHVTGSPRDSNVYVVVSPFSVSA